MKKSKEFNILVTGTPGTGKSTTAAKLAEEIGFKHYDISQMAKSHGWLMEYDSDYDAHVLDEDKCLDALEEIMKNGGNIVDYHGCDFFPERWFDIVVVMRCSTEILYDRLVKRGYSGKKLIQNQECEIMQVLLEDAKECYNEDIIKELISNTNEDFVRNVAFIASLIK